MKNKEGNVVFVEQYWKLLSEEAKDIAAKMTAKDPANRISAKEALLHPWFQVEHSSTTGLATAQENMKKYNDKNRFKMEKIKPEFSMVTCSPLLASKFAGVAAVNSPQLAAGNRNPFVAQSPMPIPSRLVKGEDAKKVTSFRRNLYIGRKGWTHVPEHNRQIRSAEKETLVLHAQT